MGHMTYTSILARLTSRRRVDTSNTSPMSSPAAGGKMNDRSSFQTLYSRPHNHKPPVSVSVPRTGEQVLHVLLELVQLHDHSYK